MLSFVVAVAFLLGMSSLSLADPPENSNVQKTPSLVLPAEEASNKLAPKTQGEAAEIVLPDAGAEKNDGSLAGTFLSGYVAHSQGDVKSAIRFLKASIAKDPDNLNLIGQLLVLHLTYGNVDEAAALAKKLIKNDRRELIADLLLAIEAVKKGDLPQAKNFLVSTESRSFDHIWLPLLLGWMENDTKKLVEVQPKDIVGEGETPIFISYHTALLNDFRGHHALARKQYQDTVKDLSRAPFRAILAYVHVLARENDREHLQQLLVDLDRDRPDMAELIRRELPFLQRLADDKPLPQTAFIGTVEEGVAEVLLTMASMLYALETSQDIPLYLQLAIYLKPDFPTAQLMLGNYYESMELWQEAGEQYRQIRESSPLYLKAGLRRAYILEKQDQSEKADALLNGFMRQFPESLEVVISKGDMLRNRAKFEEAITYYDKALSMQPSPPADDAWMLYFARGACYERLKNFAAAEKDLKKSLELSPEQPEVLNYLGYMWLDENRQVEEAVELIKMAYKLAPDQPHIVDSMGWAFLKTGKIEEAIALFENAAETMPTDPTINEHLGDAYWVAGRELEARYQWQRAVDFAEEGTDTALLTKKIKDGLEVFSFSTTPEKTPAQNDKVDKEPDVVIENRLTEPAPGPVSGTPGAPGKVANP